MIGRLVLAAVISLAAWYEPLGSSSQQPNDATLWVTLGDSDILAEVDPYAFKEIRRIKVDPKPHGLATSPDGSKVYLTSDRVGNFQVVDVATGQITARLPLGKDPNQMTLTKDGRHAYVPMRGENRIDLVQLDPLKLVKSFPSDKGPHDAYTTADGSRIYVGAQFGRSIDVFDPATQTALPRIPTEEGVRPIEPTRDGKTLYVALSNLLGFVVVDPAARKATQRVELGKLPDGVPKPYLETFTHALQLTADERELWVTDCINDLIRIVRVSDLKEVATIQVGHFPHWFTMRPDGKVIFVSLWYSDVVSAIDVASRKVIANIQFERASGPKRILVARKGTTT